MVKLQIKPLSINEAYKGKRFRTPKYDAYIKEMLFILPHDLIVPKNNIKIAIEFGHSSVLSDCDNSVKPFLDCLVKKYGVDDRYIIEINVRKCKALKGSEYILFNFY